MMCMTSHLMLIFMRAEDKLTLLCNKGGKLSVFDLSLTNSHNAGVAARHMIGHNSGQRSELVFFQRILTCNHHSSSTIRYTLQTKRTTLDIVIMLIHSL